MKGKFRTTMLAVAMALGIGAADPAMAGITRADIDDYMEEMPELSFAPEAIDCEMAGKIGAIGAWWAIKKGFDVKDFPERVADRAELEVLKMVGEIDINFEHVDPNNSKKGAKEILDVYKGFFVNAVSGVKQEDKKGSMKDKRATAKRIGEDSAVFCEHFKETGFEKVIALYKVYKGEL